MLAQLRMELKTDYQDFGYYQSSNLQGVIMEKISQEYASFLHEQGLNPYSQYVERTQEKIVWVINTLNKESYQEIIVPFLDESFQKFELKKKEIVVEIVKKQIKTVSKRQLVEEFYNNDAQRYLNIEFLTPSSFKSHGNYCIIPDLRLIYQSLMNKCESCCSEISIYDEELLEELVNNSYITGYRLNSTTFPIEGIKIPSFKGRIRIRIKGPETLAKYIMFLAKCGEYSGVGIKTAMGMGAMKIIETDRGQKNDN